jgi:negative regulator of replication initiation
VHLSSNKKAGKSETNLPFFRCNRSKLHDEDITRIRKLVIIVHALTNYLEIYENSRTIARFISILVHAYRLS